MSNAVRDSQVRVRPPPIPQGQVERLLFVLANAMGFDGSSGLVRDYLAGQSIAPRVGSHGTFHFDLMMRELGLEPPRA